MNEVGDREVAVVCDGESEEAVERFGKCGFEIIDY